MKLWQAFKMAFKSISMKKMRSFLTMLGIIIGVASVVIMVSVVQGQNRKNMEYFEKMGDLVPLLAKVGEVGTGVCCHGSESCSTPRSRRSSEE